MFYLTLELPTIKSK